MKLQHPLISNTNDNETLDIVIEKSHISITGENWSITILKEGLATVIRTHRENHSDSKTYLTQPTHREVRAKVREGGRTQLTDFERTIMDITKSIV